MKKLSVFSALLLTAAVNYSCSNEDKPVVPDNSTVIELDGHQYKTDLIATFKGEVGTEVTLTLGVYDAFDIYGVDFGDGEIKADTVCSENGGLKDENGLTKEGTTHKSATKFTGTVAGDGTIKVYGKSDLWYVLTTDGAIPTSFDQPKLAKVVQMSISGANVEAVALPAYECMTQFSLNNSSAKSVDVSKVPTLTSLTINSTSASKFEPQLTSIDVSNNPELTYLSLQGATNKQNGKLTSLDLTNNTKLENVYVQDNQITEVKMAGKYEKLSIFNGQNNKLTAFDLSLTPAMKSLYLAGNQLTTINPANCTKMAWFDVKENQLEGEIDLTNAAKLTNVYVNGNKLTAVKVNDVTKQFYFDNNQMTLATMPDLPASMNDEKKKKQFHYAPQADMEVTLQGAVLDLSAQASAKGMEAEPQATVFIITAGDAILEADKDYKIENGRIEFLADQKDVIVKMTNAGFPDLILCTKPFEVKK